jgi:hypothetical protein
VQTMLTVLTQNSRFRRDAGCISSKWRRKGEFSPGAERLPGRGPPCGPSRVWAPRQDEAKMVNVFKGKMRG